MNYLRHVVSEGGVALDEWKIETIKNWPVPKDKHEIRSYVGLCIYYRWFIPEFAKIAKPLRKLTKDGRSFSQGM